MTESSSNAPTEWHRLFDAPTATVPPVHRPWSVVLGPARRLGIPRTPTGCDVDANRVPGISSGQRNPDFHERQSAVGPSEIGDQCDFHGAARWRFEVVGPQLANTGGSPNSVVRRSCGTSRPVP